MLQTNISRKILSLGPDIKGKGGMASVLGCYASYIFQPFYYIRTTGEGGTVLKAFLLLKTFVLIPFYIVCKNVEIIHVHSASGISFKRKRLIIYFCSIFNIEVIFHLHGGTFHLFADKYGIDKIRRTFLKCKKIVVLSTEWEEYIHKTFDCTHTVIVSNIIPSPQMLTPKNDIDVLKILFLGAINESKGLFDLLEVLSVHKEFYADKIKLIIGGVGEVNKLENFIQTNELDSFVNFIGWVFGSAKIEVLNDSHVYILPSYNEGLPISILEAMSYGKAIISTNVGGIPEILHDGINGFSFVPGDLSALHCILQKCVEERNTVNEMGKQSEIIVRDFLPSSVCAQLNLLYTEILKSGRVTCR